MRFRANVRCRLATSLVARIGMTTDKRTETTMGKGLSRLMLSLLITLGGCGSAPDQIGRAADAARNATERMADASEAQSNAREAQIVADARDYEQKNLERSIPENGGRARYEIRRDGPGWTVYDTANHRPARIGAKLQNGLSRDEAESMFTSLQREDAQDQAQFR